MKTNEYLHFILRNRRFLGFGFLLAFSCNLGQTFFIGIYNAPIREAYGLSNGKFGAIYGIATLFSATMLVWIGRLVDHVDLRTYTLSVVAVMIIACLLVYGGTSVLTLGVALALLRLTGQGLMPHISSTSMGRYFYAARGRAISIAHMGINAGVIILPVTAAFLTGLFGWRGSWAAYAAGLAFIILPLILLLLKGHSERHRRWQVETDHAENRTGGSKQIKSPLKETVFRDKRFFIILPGLLSIPLFGTAVFFFQSELLTAKGWESNLFAFSFPFYSIAMLTAMLGGGWLIDKTDNSLKVLPFINIPFIIALLGFIHVNAQFWFPFLLALIGLSNGFATVIGGTLWPELYGTRILGSVRSFITALSVLGTSLAPAVVGFLYDSGVSVSTTHAAFAVYMFVGSIIQIPLGYKRLMFWKTATQNNASP